MIKQEPIDINLIKSEPIDGNLTTSDIVSEFLGATVLSDYSSTQHEPMEQDVPIPPVTLQSTRRTGPAGQPWSTTAASSMMVNNFQKSGNVGAFHGSTTSTQIKPVSSQPKVAQLHKVNTAPVTTVSSGKKQIYITTASSPNKVIAIPGGSVPRLQGLTSLSRFQLITGQSKLGPQTTLKSIAPRFATSAATGSRPQLPAPTIKIISSGPRAATQVSANSNQAAGTVVQQPRLLIHASGHPGAPQLRTIAPNLGGLPPGATIQFPVGTIIKDGVVYVPQQVQQGTPSGLPTVQITPAVSNITQPVNGVQEPLSPSRQRKPCNCTKSQCLKLYCDCFANGEFCSNCNCNNCSNNIEHESERSKAIKACLERNPHAFHPKIGKGKGETDRRHNKGCHCKRSGCLKNYCECYEAKILCTNICKCTGCKNFEESPERKTLMHLADAAEVRVQQQNAAKTKLESQMEDLPSRAPILAHAGEKLPFSYVTKEVVEATCRCLLLQASEAEKANMSQNDTQKLILEEFGNCLLKVIHTASNRSAC